MRGKHKRQLVRFSSQRRAAPLQDVLLPDDNLTMPGPKKPSKKSPARPSQSKQLTPVDGKKMLADCTLQDALGSVYSVFAAVLGAYHIPRSAKLFEEDIPGMVYDVAIGAGWLPSPPDVELAENQSRLHGKQLVSLGDSKVERWYKDSFMAALEDCIRYRTEPPDTRQRRIENLPEYTSKEERQILLDSYIANRVDRKSVV